MDHDARYYRQMQIYMSLFTKMLIDGLGQEVYINAIFLLTNISQILFVVKISIQNIVACKIINNQNDAHAGPQLITKMLCIE